MHVNWYYNRNVTIWPLNFIVQTFFLFQFSKCSNGVKKIGKTNIFFLLLCIEMLIFQIGKNCNSLFECIWFSAAKGAQHVMIKFDSFVPKIFHYCSENWMRFHLLCKFSNNFTYQWHSFDATIDIVNDYYYQWIRYDGYECISFRLVCIHCSYYIYGYQRYVYVTYQPCTNISLALCFIWKFDDHYQLLMHDCAINYWLKRKILIQSILLIHGISNRLWFCVWL